MGWSIATTVAGPTGSDRDYEAIWAQECVCGLDVDVLVRGFSDNAISSLRCNIGRYPRSDAPNLQSDTPGLGSRMHHDSSHEEISLE